MPAAPPNNHVDLSREVNAAAQSGRAVVALESTIITHGMPYPRNAETALAVEAEVRQAGAIPATIAILGGRLKVGLSAEEIQTLAKRGPEVTKCSRRDLSVLVARRMDGATTVAATMIVAAMAGIPVFATGGIGGVHRGGEQSLDISADLDELSRTNVAVVCSGVKSILDIPRTLEYLETKGVAVIGYKTDTLPAFYTRSSGLSVDYRCDSAAEVAATLRTKNELEIDGGTLIAVPVPHEHALENAAIDAVIDAAIIEMNEKNVSGKEATPFLLAKIAERTDGKSLVANIQLILNNARVASQIAVALAETK